MPKAISKPTTPNTTETNTTTSSTNTPTQPNKDNQKVVEFYIETLAEYKRKLQKEKLIILMQVGEFFEVYGLIYPNGNHVGDIWEFCDNVNLKIAEKKQDVFKNPDIKVYMGGVQTAYINPYIQKAVEKFGWTVVMFEQVRSNSCNSASAKFDRVETAIISPGVNINSDSFSNISMVIYIEQIKSYYNSSTTSQIHHTTTTATAHSTQSYKKFPTDNQVNIGVSFIDCLTGANGVLSINNATASDIAIPFDELLKILTIKNPKELNIYIQNYNSITDEDLINALHLFNYQFKIIRETINDKYSNLNYQSMLLDSVYGKHRGILNIMQQLDIESAEHNYSRISLILLLEFVISHDKTIIEKLEQPEILLNSDKYLMLANNCLEQLDIIDNMRSQSHSDPSQHNTNYNTNSTAKRISLLELLDNTKTPLGKMCLRQRLSIPVTSAQSLNQRYKIIAEMESLHNNYMKIKQNDKYGSPLHQLRFHLNGIKNIDNYLRKLITQKIQPSDIGIYVDSLQKCITVYDYIMGQIQNSSSTSSSNSTSIFAMLPDNTTYETFKSFYKTFINNINLDLLTGSIWGALENNPFKKGVSPKLDDLQMEIDNDRGFLDSLIAELTKIGSADSRSTVSHNINIGDNASKGIHIFTNSTKKNILETYFSKVGGTNTTTSTTPAKITVGKYTITAKDIKFIQMRESKWEIEISYLKISNGTLRANIERLSRLVKTEFINWFQNTVLSEKPDILDSLHSFSKFIAEIDVLQSNVINVVEKGYVSPVIVEGDGDVNSYIKAENLRHPIIEHITKATNYVPNDVTMGTDGVNGILLFGVNAVGKSSLMKSIGINIIMAQAGMYVAASKFTFKPYKYLFTRIRNNDNIYAGLSSFEVEMKEFKVILKYANADSIILGDELCSGTETQDATALVASGIGQLSRRNSSFIFATHLHFLADMAYIKNLNNVKLCHMSVGIDPNDPRKLIYSRKIHNGSGMSSYGILVCETMNLDGEFIEKAKEIRASMNRNGGGSGGGIGSVSVAIASATVTTSKYNPDKVVAICEVCSSQPAVDVHHINQQCDANENSLIHNHEFGGIFNKNKLWNLIALCKDCHQSIHSVPSKLEIHGYVSTSLGIELQYKWLDQKEPGLLVSSENGLQVSSEPRDFRAEKGEIGVAKPAHINGKTVKGDNKENAINDEIKTHIINMKQNGNTPKKIQYDLKRQKNIEISQQQIRELV